MKARVKSPSTITDCGRCGAPLGMHWERVPGNVRKNWIGCPFPAGFLVGQQVCAFLNCESTDSDPLLGLCPEHRVRAERGLASRAWKTDQSRERNRNPRSA